MSSTKSKEQLRALAAETSLYPQEQLLKVSEGEAQLDIGLPREMEAEENRVSLTPEGAGLLIANGNHVRLEAGAGQAAKFQDTNYSESGCEVVYSPEDVFKSRVVMKVAPPTLKEIEYMQPGSVLISALPVASITQDFIKALMKKKITAIAYEFLEDDVKSLPIVRSMSEIAGSTAMLIAAEYLSSPNKGRGIIMGGITGVPPTKITILGAGTVAEFAARIGMGMGAEVKVFDNNLYKLRRLKEELGNHLYTSTLDSSNLRDAITRSDVVIGALRAEEGRTPMVVTEEMIAEMQADSVVIDVSIDQGGCIETSEVRPHSSPVYRRHEVIHYCVPNIPSRVAHTATTALSNIFTPILLKAQQYGGIEDFIFEKEWFMDGVYLYRGSLTNKFVANRVNMTCKDLNLLRAARL